MFLKSENPMGESVSVIYISDCYRSFMKLGVKYSAIHHR